MLQSDTLHGIIPWIDGLSFVGIVGVVVKGSDWLDSMLNDEGRAAITKWLKNVPTNAQDESWPNALSGLIDNVFGERPISFKFFGRSCIASIIAVTLVWLVYARLQLRAGYRVHDFEATILISLLISLIPDYLSLLVSRTIIMLIPRSPRLLRVISLLVADAALTAIIALVSLLPGFYILIAFLGFRDAGFNGALKFAFTLSSKLFAAISTLSVFNLGTQDPMRGATIFFYSSFFTSMWLWLYVTAGFTIKAARKTRILWLRASKYLDIDKKPLGCIGKVSGLLLASLWALFIGLEHALGSPLWELR